MKPTYLMALDAGTTSNRCILFDRSGSICGAAQKEFTQIFPHPGWVEHDPEEIFATQLEVARQAMRGIGAQAADIAAIGITNQRETTVVWNRHTGKPIANAIVWQCRRTAAFCDRLRETWAEPIRQKTGLVVDPYFSATKIRWLLDHVPGAQAQAEAGDLLFGTVETWLIWKFTGGRVHVTDYSNASRTMLFNLRTLQWDREILDRLHIPAAMLPTPVPSSAVYGETAAEFFGAPIPIAGAAGDQQAALFGQTCLNPGDAKCTYGTGAFLLMNTGSTPVFSQNGLVTTVAWGLDGDVTYALEGSIFVAGAAIQWLRDELRFIESASDSEYMAKKGPRYRRLLCGPRLHRPRRSLLGRLRPGLHRRPDPRRQQIPHHPGHAGLHRLSGPGRAGRHGRRRRAKPCQPEGRRRRRRQQLPDAKSGRPLRLHRAAPPVRGNHRRRRRLSGRTGRGLLGQRGGDPEPLGRGPGLCAGAAAGAPP